MSKNFSVVPTRYELLLLIEGINCNPNGDPDNEGAPRTDPETGHGLTSGQSTNRRVIDATEFKYENKPPYKVLIHRKSNIEAEILNAGENVGVKVKTGKGSKKLSSEDKEKVRKAVCDMYFQARKDGAVLQVGSMPVHNINGAVTTMMGKSIYPVDVQKHAITRVCASNSEQDKDQEMGRKYTIPHVVITQKIFVNPFHAEQNGFSVKDLAITIDALVNLYEHKRSAMGGEMYVRGLWAFRHDSKFGNAPSHTLFDRIQITCDNPKKARSWHDYEVKADLEDLPKGITVFNIEDFLGGVDSIIEKLDS